MISCIGDLVDLPEYVDISWIPTGPRDVLCMIFCIGDLVDLRLQLSTRNSSGLAWCSGLGEWGLGLGGDTVNS